MPTTLLAQLDSAADVKQSVNAPHIKNAIGMYRAPDRVVIDSTMLATLPEREILSGFGEAIKHAFSQDLKLVDRILGAQVTDIDTLEYITRRAIKLKIEHWKNTPTIWNDHKKIERLTHLGHTTGKILEMINVDYLTHGEAVSHGMVIEAYVSNALGLLDDKSVDFMRAALYKRGLLFPLDESYSTDVIVEELYSNNAVPIFALLKELGNPVTESTSVDRDIMERSLQTYFEWVNNPVTI
jgi:3-dehydroquinate synthase